MKLKGTMRTKIVIFIFFVNRSSFSCRLSWPCTFDFFLFIFFGCGAGFIHYDCLNEEMCTLHYIKTPFVSSLLKYN